MTNCGIVKTKIKFNDVLLTTMKHAPTLTIDYSIFENLTFSKMFLK
jgi:hypothetical protein